jgi:hypothetical protein
MVAPLLLDLLWPFFLFTGLEQVRIQPGITAFSPMDFTRFPCTHSLVMAVVWSLLFAGLYRARTGYAAGALWIGIGVFSHWVLDFVSHRPDLQLVPGLPLRVGLGLWNSPTATIAVEAAMYVAGVAVYLGTTRARDRRGSFALWSFVLVMAALYASTIVGPPPPNPGALEIAAFVTWVFVPWVYWIDRHREVLPTVR